MDEFSTLCLGIPTINQAELLNKALETYKDTFYGRHIFIVDNGNQKINRVSQGMKIMVQKQNLGVAASWNLICKMAFSQGYTHVAIMNDDIVCEKYADDIEDFIDITGAGIYTGYKNFSVFIISYETYKYIGPFDEDFVGAYFEDSDYLYRCKLKGVFIEQTELLNPEVYNQSLSIRKDPQLNKNFEQNKTRYLQKWGGVPTEEKYLTPYNQ